MPKDKPSIQELVSSLEAFLEPTEQRLEPLRDKIRQLKKYEKLLSELCGHLRQRKPLHAWRILTDNSEFIWDQTLSSSVMTPEELTILVKMTQDILQRIFKWYPEALERVFDSEKLPLDMTSRHPVYTFQKGFLELRIENDGIANISDSEGRLARFPGDIKVVVEKVREELSRLFERPFDGESFLRDLWNCYCSILQEENLCEGRRVPIRQLAARVSALKKDYQLDEFVVDLSRLAREGPVQIDGRRLELQHTRDTEQGMLLHDVDTVGYVGFILFEEVGS